MSAQKAITRLLSWLAISGTALSLTGCGSQVPTKPAYSSTQSVRPAVVQYWQKSGGQAPANIKTAALAKTATRSIRQENNLPGTTAWRITKPANGRIQGYASLDSVNAGGSITMYVSTQRNGDNYDIRVFRLGWYHGKGGRLMRATPYLKGLAQGWWNAATGDHHLPPQNHPKGFLNLHWHPSYLLKVPTNWVSGYYVALLTDTDGYQSYIPFVVRDDTHAHKFLVDVPVNTWQAYNYWGDWAFYGHYNKYTRRQKGYKNNNAVEVSFNRPYAEDNGAGLTFLEFPTIYWMESQGYNVAYTTSVALDAPKRTWQPTALISVGHDEYWSSNMRNNVTNMLNDGVNLAFFGANDMYWRVRYANNHRTLIGYRWEPAADPLHGTSAATGAWRQLGQPESAITGAMYAGQPYGDQYTWSDPKWIVSDPHSWLFHGLKVHRGEAVPGIIGWEFDSAINAYTPHKHITILSKSPIVDRIHRDRIHYLTTTLYQAPSGAYVFDAATIWWGYGLANPVDYEIYEGNAVRKPYYLPPSPIIQGVTRNLLNRYAQG